MKAFKQIDAPNTPPVQAVREVGEVKKERELAIYELSKLCEAKKCADYERDVLQASLQRAEC